MDLHYRFHIDMQRNMKSSLGENKIDSKAKCDESLHTLVRDNSTGKFGRHFSVKARISN